MKGVVGLLPVFSPYVLTEEDIGPQVPPKWQQKIQVGKNIDFTYKGYEEPFDGLQAGQTVSDVRGLAIGKRELVYCLGWWVDGMTEKGKALAEHDKLDGPSKFQSGDLVACLETSDDVSIDDCYHLYILAEVPLGHKDRASSSDKITCQWFQSVSGEKAAGDTSELKISTTYHFLEDDTFKADTMMLVDLQMVNIISGGLKNNVKCELEINLNVYCKIYYSATKDDPGKGTIDESDEEMDPAALIVTDDTYDPTSLNSVLGRLPVFLSTKSMLEEIVSKAGHILLLSSKYHTEVAGQGIEYCFGRTKWWLKRTIAAQLQH